MKNWKTWLLIGLKTALLYLPLVVLVPFLGEVMAPKDYNEAIALIEEQPDGAYDVLLAGPSHMQYAVNPAQLYGEYGIASANVCTSAQTIPITYHMLKEMIQRHDPQLVVLDIFDLAYEDLTPSPARVHQALDFFPLSKNKIEAVQDLVEENREEFYFPVLLYHSRWKELIRRDYMLSQSDANETYQILNGTQPFPGEFQLLPETQTAPIPEIPLEYLTKIRDLCRETDTQLLLTVIPYRADLYEESFHEQRIFNSGAALAKEWGVDYINGLHYLEEMGFDFTTDMIENSHVNLSGAVKTSAFYGKYLRDHYDLPDRSQDPAYAHWQEDYAEYLEKVAELAG